MNSDFIFKVASYIQDKTYNNFSLKDAQKISTVLINEYHFSEADILNGKADYLLNELISVKRNFEEIKKSSIANSNEENKPIPLNTKKKFVMPEKLKKIILKTSITIASLAIVITIVTAVVKDFEFSSFENSVDTQITALAGYDSGRLPYHSMYSTSETSGESFAYDTGNMAMDMVNIAVQNGVFNKDLLKLSLYENYKYIEYNTFDTLSRAYSSFHSYLPSYLPSGVVLPDSFLGYLLEDGCIPEGINYNDITSIVEKYKRHPSFADLSEEEQNTVKKMCKMFKNSVEDNIEYYEGFLKNITMNDTDNFGGR